MDRFEAGTMQTLRRQKFNLHSSMDRFEASNRMLYKPYLVYLHSSMDRFEGELKNKFRFTLSEIYIPVWIDLKDDNLSLSDKVKQIYIPVWIDLKWR